MSELAFESAIVAAMVAVLADCGINAAAGRASIPAPSYPRVLVKTDDIEPIAASGETGSPRAWGATVYLYCDTYFPDDPTGAANASLVRLVRGCTFSGLATLLAAKAPAIAFFAAFPVKDYSADEVNLRRTVMEIAVRFSV